MVLRAEPASAPVLMQRGLGGFPHDRAASLSSPVETTAVAHGGNPRIKALPPQDRAASPRP